MNRQYHKWHSPRLNREMELLVFGHAGARVLVFPTRQGRFFDYENWGLVSALSSSIDAGLIQLYCVDSVDSETFYCSRCPPELRLSRHRQYEEYILREMLPLSELLNPRSFLIAHGCSIGAFHAINIAFRHPGLFGKVVALSGRYDLTQEIGPFQDLFQGFYNQEVYFNTPNHFVPNMHEPSALEKLRRTEVVLAVGEDDPFRDSTVRLSQALHSQQIGHQLAIWTGEAHRPRYWRRMVKLYL